MRKPWTIEDVKALRSAWRKGGRAAALAAFPERSEASVENKAYALKLQRHKRAWTTAELRTLKWATWEGGKRLAAQMLPGRTESACGTQAYKMRYPRNPDWINLPRKHVISEAQEDVVVAARRQGMSINRLAKELGVSRCAVRRVLGGIEPMGLRTV